VARDLRDPSTRSSRQRPLVTACRPDALGGARELPQAGELGSGGPCWWAARRDALSGATVRDLGLACRRATRWRAAGPPGAAFVVPTARGAARLTGAGGHAWQGPQVISLTSGRRTRGGLAGDFTVNALAVPAVQPARSGRDVRIPRRSPRSARDWSGLLARRWTMVRPGAPRGATGHRAGMDSRAGGRGGSGARRPLRISAERVRRAAGIRRARRRQRGCVSSAAGAPLSWCCPSATP
jgi:hypothetical protein